MLRFRVGERVSITAEAPKHLRGRVATVTRVIPEREDKRYDYHIKYGPDNWDSIVVWDHELAPAFPNSPFHKSVREYLRKELA